MKSTGSVLSSRGSGGLYLYKKLCSILYDPRDGYNKDVTGKYYTTPLWERMRFSGFAVASRVPEERTKSAMCSFPNATIFYHQAKRRVGFISTSTVCCYFDEGKVRNEGALDCE